MGYFIIPLSSIGAKSETETSGAAPTVSALLAIQVNIESFYTNVLPDSLRKHLDAYAYRIAIRDKTLFSNSGGTASRRADLIVPVFGDFFSGAGERDEAKSNSGKARAAGDAMRNPVSRFWFLRISGFPNFDPRHFSLQDIRRQTPLLEIFYPERSLSSAMHNRMLSSVLLSLGTLVVLLSSYFVLYTLLARTDTLRARERDFVTSMSHELRTPISVINATSDNLATGIVGSSEKTKKYGNLIQAQSRRLGKMVESILFYSGLEYMDADSMTRDEIDLETFFSEIAENLSPDAAASVRNASSFNLCPGNTPIAQVPNAGE
jgi:signal transduction histidine kinase